jgi:hypothetical protein
MTYQNMTEEGRQHRQTTFNIFALPVPVDEGAYCESVPKAVQARAASDS